MVSLYETVRIIIQQATVLVGNFDGSDYRGAIMLKEIIV
jgi:hypothetical protein